MNSGSSLIVKSQPKNRLMIETIKKVQTLPSKVVHAIQSMNC